MVDDLMLCYKDRTFCQHWLKCADGEECGRALTQAVKDGADRANLYISQYLGHPDCFKDKTVQK